jgi:serine phosphatase RsbU (regulator of sigma subunit)
MKKGIITLFAIFVSVFTYAQKTELELVRSAFRLEKKAIVGEFLQLNDADATKFWPIYEKYEQERAEAGTRRINLIETYASKYEDMDDATADALVKESVSIQKKELALREKYYKIVQKEISTSIAARFYQIEDAVHVGVLNELNSMIPMLDKQ